MKSRYHKFILIACLALLNFSVLFEYSAYGQEDKVAPEEARKYIGQTKTVCGRVASTKYTLSSKGSPTFLNLNKPYPNHIFTIVIWGSNRHKFDSPPEKFYEGKDICVTGMIESYKGTPEIIVETPSQITSSDMDITTSNTVNSDYYKRYSQEEILVIKAILAALGYEVDYNRAAWSNDSNKAAIDYQRKHSLQPDGKIGPTTLRSLSNSVSDFTHLDYLEKSRVQLFLNKVALREELNQLAKERNNYQGPSYSYGRSTRPKVGEEVEFYDYETGDVKIGVIESIYDDEVEVYEYEEGELHNLDIDDLE